MYFCLIVGMKMLEYFTFISKDTIRLPRLTLWKKLIPIRNNLSALRKLDRSLLLRLNFLNIKKTHFQLKIFFFFNNFILFSNLLNYLDRNSQICFSHQVVSTLQSYYAWLAMLHPEKKNLKMFLNSKMIIKKFDNWNFSIQLFYINFPMIHNLLTHKLKLLIVSRSGTFCYALLLNTFWNFNNC